MAETSQLFDPIQIGSHFDKIEYPDLNFGHQFDTWESVSEEQIKYATVYNEFIGFEDRDVLAKKVDDVVLSDTGSIMEYVKSLVTFSPLASVDSPTRKSHWVFVPSDIRPSGLIYVRLT